MYDIARLSNGGVGCQEIFPGSDYTADEREFLVAMDRYKRLHRRPHPSWREVLHVLRALGWRKAPAATAPDIDGQPRGGSSTGV
jgi:hypothetical protein